MNYNSKWNIFVFVGLILGSAITFLGNIYWSWFYYSLFVSVLMALAPSNHSKFAIGEKEE